jgi:hypothetical protein
MGFWSKLFGSKDSQNAPASPKDVFAAEVEAILRSAGVTDASYDREAFAFKVGPDESDWTLYLDNLFVETREVSPEARAERILSLVRDVSKGHDEATDWEDVRDRLVPVLRPCTNFIQAGFGPGKTFHGRAFAPFLLECLVVDSYSSLAYVGRDMSDEWERPLDELYETARANLASHATADVDVELFDKDAPYRLWRVSRNDSYETSRLLLPGWLASFASRVDGRPVAIAPERATLIVGGDGSTDCLRRLLDIAQRECKASPRSISPALYSVDSSGAVVPLELPADHPLRHDVELGHMSLAATEYETQKELLDKELGEDVFVATFAAVKNKDGSYMSYCTWAKDVPSLLPRTQQIALGDPKAQKSSKPLMAAWDDVLEGVGDCLVQEPGMNPPRWRTTRWPDESVLAALRAASAS